MSFRRLPFQFTTTDPVERQRELERRFGLPSSNMYVDVPNPLSAGAVPKETNSPRLQHRVPIFVEGHDKPIQSSVDAMGSAPETKKPNVRIIPIEIEGAERPYARHRTFSGPAGIPKQSSLSPENTGPSAFKHSVEDLSHPSKVKPTAGPRVHNIPIQVEGAGTLKADKTKTKNEPPKMNGCPVTKSPNKVESPVKEQKVEPKKEHKTDPVEIALKKIQDVLEEFRAYEKGVQDFCGTTKDKQYRYLDEMLTRCMLKLDELDTMGNENLRCARKSAVKQIQASIDLLESKANADAGMKQVTNEVADDQNEQPGGEIAEKIEGSDVEMQDDLAPESQENLTLAADEVKLPDKRDEVEMKESVECANSTLSNEDITSSEAMSGTAEVLNQVIDKVEENDVEMQNSNAEENREFVVSTSESEIAPPVDKVEVSEKPVEENLSQVPEVEMGEVQASTVSSADEVQITENSDADTKETKSDAKDETVSQDVEMKDVQNSEVNSTVLDSQYNSIESTEQGADACSDELEEQCTVGSSQSEGKDSSYEDKSAKSTTQVTENCVLASDVIDSSNSVDSSQN